jgi:protein tyrosine phosphatase (PTP) superfamily phosphohydrolase (DUF442 family)
MKNKWLAASLVIAAISVLNSKMVYSSETTEKKGIDQKTPESGDSAETKKDSTAETPKKHGEPGHKYSKKHHPKSSGHHKEEHHKDDHHKSGQFFKDAKFGSFNVKAHDKLIISGLPDKAALDAMKVGGVKVLIDVRPLDEVGNEFPKMVKAAGLKFESKPVFLKDGTIDMKAVDAITDLHKKYHDNEHVVACTVGARSSGWLTLHLVNHHKMPVDEAIQIGKEAYLSDELAMKIKEVAK